MPPEWILEENHWDQLASDWEQALTRSADNYPFLQVGIQRAWWKHRGGGEWSRESELRILVSREGGRLRGIAPFFRAAGEPQPTYRLIGSREIMDYLGVVCAPEDASAFCTVLCDELQKLPPEEWQRLDLCNLHPASPMIPAMEEAARLHAWQMEKTALEECPVVPLPSSWDEYLATLDKKQRHEIRRKLRRAEAGGELEVRIYTDGDLDAELEDFLLLMETDPRKAEFLTAPMRAQFFALASAAQQAGMLELAFLVMDGQYAAAFFNFDYQNRTWVYNSGMNPQFASLSPGWVLLAQLIQRAITRGQSAIDFMRGNEDYKFHWGGKPQHLVHLIIQK